MRATDNICQSLPLVPLRPSMPFPPQEVHSILSLILQGGDESQVLKENKNSTGAVWILWVPHIPLSLLRRKISSSSWKWITPAGVITLLSVGLLALTKNDWEAVIAFGLAISYFVLYCISAHQGSRISGPADLDLLEPNPKYVVSFTGWIVTMSTWTYDLEN